MTQQITSALPEQQWRQLQSVFFKSRPWLTDLIRGHGQESLVDYMAGYYRERLIQPVPERQTEFLGTLQAFAAKQWGENIAQAIRDQLQQYYCVSTADHHAPLFPDLAFQANVLTMAAYAQIAQPPLHAILILSCSSVSLNHRDWPRGLVYHQVQEDTIQTQRLSFFPSRLRMHPVYNCPAYQSVDLATALTTQPEKIKHVLRECYATPAVLAASNYSTQIALSNTNIWQAFTDRFQWYSTQLYYLPEEEVVTQLLLEHHLTSQTPIHQLIFSEMGQQQWWPGLAQTLGSHLSQGNTGTDLFWGMSLNKAKRVALTLRDGYLFSADHTVRYALQPEVIAQALRQGEMYPSLLLCYIVLTLYYQLNCLGGFNQAQYLSALQKQYAALAIDPLYQPANVTQLHYGLYSAFLHHGSNALPLTGLDLWVYGSNDFWSQWSAALKTVTVAESVCWLVPAFYRYLSVAEQTQYSETELTKYILTATIDQRSTEKSVSQPALVSI